MITPISSFHSPQHQETHRLIYPILINPLRHSHHSILLLPMPTNRTPTASYTPSSSSPEPFDSERVPVTIGTDIRGFLRVENRVEPDDPRIANLYHRIACFYLGKWLPSDCDKNFKICPTRPLSSSKHNL
ncbi:uncharacterized protein LOC117924947 [Vitis riparia]|uniref:uncharacterized protein LOC117924947 n=1 Tax=Vitis riparia TaxID=96939 RepID=UPI00155A8919|nr:uncharacterized protein LOC117924947 [Vitis riparia]